MTGAIGTQKIGVGMIGVDVETVFTEPINSTVSTETVDATTVADVSTTPIQSTMEMGDLSPTVLDPENLQTTFDEDRSAFVSEWFEERSPIPDTETRELVVTADLRSDEDITVFVERDDTGDGVVDERSAEQQIGHGLVDPLSSIEPVEGSRYRIVFPDYSRDDDVEALRLSLTYDNHDDLKDNFPIRDIDLRDGFLADVLTAYASALYALDTRIDEEFDDRFISTASGEVLDVLGAPVNVNRRDAEQDDELRYRIAVEYAVFRSDGTLSSVESVCRRLFENASQITIGIDTDEPVLLVTVPLAEMDAIPFTTTEVQARLKRAMPSSYNVNVNTPDTVGAIGAEKIGTTSIGVSGDVS